MVIMQLIPSLVRGLVISRSIGRWSCNAYQPRRPLSLMPGSSINNHGEEVRHGSCSSVRSKYSTIRSLSNSNESPVTIDFHEDEIIAISVDDNSDDVDVDDSKQVPQEPESRVPIWNHPVIMARVAKKRENNKLRFRQHVNPLSRLYQQPTILPENWPHSVYTSVSGRSLHLDIGCGKGGFLIDLCQTESRSSSHSNIFNYLGLEIRPAVATYAKDRINVHHLQGQLDFLGCNANVDLDRVLKLYQLHYASTAEARAEASLMNSQDLCLHRVTIQFPDPHFKTQHLKRRVVTKTLVDTIAKYMPTNGTIILQSDIQTVLDDMRRQFREATVIEDGSNKNDDQYFFDSIEDYSEYVAENCLGVPTEREQSVLVQGLPVYRSLLTRSACPYRNSPSEA